MEISNHELKEIVSPGKSALLVWDVQNRLVNNIFNRDIFLSNTKRLVPKRGKKAFPSYFQNPSRCRKNSNRQSRKLLFWNILDFRTWRRSRTDKT